MFHDLKYSLRLLLKSPAFAAVVVLSLALGMAVNTAVFTLFNILVLKPLPISRTEGLVYVSNSTTTQPYGGSAYPRYLAYAENNPVFSGLIAYSSKPLALTTAEGTEEINSEVVSANYFSVLEVNPMLGRFFLAEEDRLSAQPVAVLGYDFWKRRYAADPRIVGETIILNGRVCTVIGIASNDFPGTGGPLKTDLWLPTGIWATMVREPDRISDWGHSWTEVIGRLKPGVSREEAEAVMTTISAGLPHKQEQESETRVILTSIDDGHPRTKSEALEFALPVAAMGFVVGGLVLLIGCANAANLLLARSAARRKEIAIRLALGSSRLRLVRFLLMESLVLALLAGIAGLLLATWGINLLLKIQPPIDVPAFSIDLSPDMRVFGFTLILSLATGILFGLTPALQASKADLTTALKDVRSSAGRGPMRLTLRNLLVVSQVAMSLLLLVTAGLFARSLQNAHQITPGFNIENVYSMSLATDQFGLNIAKQDRFDELLLEQVRGLPGVESATLVDPMPMMFGGKYAYFEIEGSLNRDGERLGHIHVAPGYFQTLRISITHGRDFNDRDTKTAPKVAIINEAMAEQFWPNQNPLGRRLIHDREPIEIVGIASNTKHRDLGETAQPWLYIPMVQNTTSNRLSPTLLVRSGLNSATVALALRNTTGALDPSWPVFEIKSMADSMRLQFFLPQIAAGILGGVGLLGLALALVGIYGLVSYSVTQRTQEIGIRIALGATAASVLRLIISHSVVLTLIGVVIGGAIAAGVTQFLSSLLFGISPTDPITFIGVSLALIAAATAASIFPARRATRIDPNEALRRE
jgi:predicted permease